LAKEVRIKHDKLKDTQTITEVTRNAMKEVGCNINVNEVSKMDDDFKTGERVLTIEKQGMMFFGIGTNISQDRWDKIFSKREED